MFRRQLAQLFLQFEHEPVIVALDGVARGIGIRNLRHQGAQLGQAAAHTETSALMCGCGS